MRTKQELKRVTVSSLKTWLKVTERNLFIGSVHAEATVDRRNVVPWFGVCFLADRTE